jgi:uncharacterized iron-regulated protein
MKSDRPAYKIFSEAGKNTTFNQMIDKLQNADVVLFGELHNNAMSHWIELQVSKELYKLKKDKLVMGAEMFEADNHEMLQQYLNGIIIEDTFAKKVRLWPNYETDYKPLIEFSKENKIPFIATNIPRKYASLVMKGGFEALESLKPEEKKFVAPLPVAYDADLSQYKKMLEMSGMGNHASANFPKAQAIKDATMAYFINTNLKEGNLFLHFNGAFHSDNFQGIMWYLQKKNPDLKIVTITTVEQEDISILLKENQKVANYILCVPEDMTKTY